MKTTLFIPLFLFVLSSCGSAGTSSSTKDTVISSDESTSGGQSQKSEETPDIYNSNLIIKNFGEPKALAYTASKENGLVLVLQNEDGQYYPAQFALAEDGNVLDKNLYLRECVEFDGYSIVKFVTNPDAGYTYRKASLGEAVVFNNDYTSRWNSEFAFILNQHNGRLFSLTDLSGSPIPEKHGYAYSLVVSQSLYDPMNFYFALYGESYWNDPQGSQEQVSIPSGDVKQSDYIRKMRVGENIEYTNFASTKIADLPVLEDRHGNLMFGNRGELPQQGQAFLYSQDGKSIEVNSDFLGYDFANKLFLYEDGYFSNDHFIPADSEIIEYYRQGYTDPIYLSQHLFTDGESHYFLRGMKVYKIRPTSSASYERTVLFSGEYLVANSLVHLDLTKGFCSTYNLATQEINKAQFDNDWFGKTRIESITVENDNLVITAFEGFLETVYYVSPFTGVLSTEPIEMDQTIYSISAINADEYFEDIGWQNRIFYNMSGIAFKDMEVVYDGQEHELTIDGILPDGVSVSYTHNKLTNIGSIEVTASFTSTAKYYEPIPDMVAVLTIVEPETSSESI